MRPVAFSPDDQILAAGNDDGTVKLWRVAKLRK
jgi:WD40 repeat protein